MTFLRKRYHYLTLAILATLVASTHAAEPEYLRGKGPVAPSVEQSREPMEEAYAPEKPSPSLFPNLKQRLQSAPPFWRDTRLTFLPRMYSLNRPRDGAADIGAWALGGQLQYRSGWYRQRIQLGVSGYTSQKISGRREKDGSLLLKPGQQSFSVLGEAYLKARLTDSTWVRLYRQPLDVPYVNGQDSRMLPNTFEAYTLVTEELANTVLGVSHVRKMKRRNDDGFIYMSEAAGFDDTEEPLTMVGGRYTFREGVSLGAINQYAWEFMNTFYAEADGVWRLNDDLALRIAGQYTDQRSVGDEIDGDFDTSVYGVKTALSYRHATLTLAHTSTDDGSRIRSPFGGYPGYLSIIVKDFNRADEDAWLVGISYEFSRIGIPGLSTFMNYADGNTPDSGNQASPDQREFDVTVDYRFESGPLKGLWLRARAAFVNQDDDVAGAVDLDDYRFIVNYEIPIL